MIMWLHKLVQVYIYIRYEKKNMFLRLSDWELMMKADVD